MSCHAGRWQLGWDSVVAAGGADPSGAAEQGTQGMESAARNGTRWAMRRRGVIGEKGDGFKLKEER